MNIKQTDNKIFWFVGFIIIFTANMTAHVAFTAGELVLAHYPIFLLTAFSVIMIKPSILKRRLETPWSFRLFRVLMIVVILEALSMACSIYLVLEYLCISPLLVYIEILLMEYLLGVVIHFSFLAFKFPTLKKDTVRLIRNAFFLAIIYPVTFALLYFIALTLKLY